MVTAGERKAVWSATFGQLEYWTSHNTSQFANCKTWPKARAIIKRTKVEQTLTGFGIRDELLNA